MGAGSNIAGNGEIFKESLNMYGIESFGSYVVVEANEATYPSGVALLGAEGVVAAADLGAELLQERVTRWGFWGVCGGVVEPALPRYIGSDWDVGSE